MKSDNWTNTEMIGPNGVLEPGFETLSYQNVQHNKRLSGYHHHSS